MTRKKIDLGEYVIDIKYNKETGELSVEVFDEGGELIEGINITDDNPDDSEPVFNLN